MTNDSTPICMWLLEENVDCARLYLRVCVCVCACRQRSTAGSVCNAAVESSCRDWPKKEVSHHPSGEGCRRGRGKTHTSTLAQTHTKQKKLHAHADSLFFFWGVERAFELDAENLSAECTVFTRDVLFLPHLTAPQRECKTLCMELGLSHEEWRLVPTRLDLPSCKGNLR